MYQTSSSPSAKELGACGLRGWAKAAATASALRSPDANTHVCRERAIMGTVSVTRSGGGFGGSSRGGSRGGGFGGGGFGGGKRR